MAGRFQRMYEAEREKVLAFERVREQGSRDKILKAALAVINRNRLTKQFVDELSKVEKKK